MPLPDTATATDSPILRQSSINPTERTHVRHIKREQEVVVVAISALHPGEYPRTEGQDHEHIMRLAEAEVPLPPIVVNRSNMQVIDGVHRVFAAVLRGEDKIRAVFFDGSAEDAFLCAVQANTAHGLPLSLADRRAAAERIVISHANLSDRAIARATGLGAKTVAALRRRLFLSASHTPARIGMDGKARPVNGADGRLRAAQVLAERPNASLREVARLAGISPATVSDVKRRLAAGEPPVTDLSSAPKADTQNLPVPGQLARLRSRQPRAGQVTVDPRHALVKLLRDPSLRHRQIGRELLRLLRYNAIAMDEWPKLLAAVPQHCRQTTADLARQYAESWVQFEEQVRAIE